MSTKHTPGPWGPRSLPDMVGTDQMLIASVYPMHNEAPEECEANARLIAAAPDLLAAAKLYAEWCAAEIDHTKADFYERIQMCSAAEKATLAAIAKATGEAL